MASCDLCGGQREDDIHIVRANGTVYKACVVCWKYWGGRELAPQDDEMQKVLEWYSTPPDDWEE